MNRFVRRKTRCVLLLIVALWPWEVRAQLAGSEPTASGSGTQEQVVVLRDGGVLSGQIARDGERYVVTRAGSELRIPAAEVVLVCASLDEAYNQRRRQMSRPSADGHLTLAEWCLRHNLIEAARRELADARALDARHPRLALLERRLVQAGKAPGDPAAASGAGVSRRDEPAGSRIFTPNAVDVPTGVVERFTRKVQPVLVNNCTASRCHQPGGKQAFQLDRALLHGMANRRSTMSNLAAALALVDRERPQLSPLLTVPRRAHGGMDDPVFGPRQEQAFRHVVEWVALVTQADSAPPDVTTGADAEADLQASNELADAGATAQAMDVEPLAETASGAAPVDFDAGEALVAGPSPPLRIGAQVRKWEPRDPFDPEIFNRAQRARRPAANAEESKTRQADR
jgi:hypothetical protein